MFNSYNFERRNTVGNRSMDDISYNFERRNTVERKSMDDVNHCSEEPAKHTSLLDFLILREWEDRAERGLFRYDVKACKTKVLDGEHGFVAQLNEGRGSKKRPTEFRLHNVLQPFDPKKFNFTKVGQEEVLFGFKESVGGVSEYYENAPIAESNLNLIMINVSPIELGHVLLVPRVMDCIPQRIDPDTLLLALHMAAEVNNRYFRLGYNSLGAFATVNQLHFQAYYFYKPFALERAPTISVSHPRGKEGVEVLQVVNYPVRCLVFEIGSSLQELAEEVARSCMALQDANIPYNMLIADCGARVFVIPQCFAERQEKGEVEQVVLDIGVNPAVWEIGGHIILKGREDYEMATEDYAWKLLAEVSLSEDRFEEVKRMCLTIPEEKSTTLTVADASQGFPAEGDCVSVGYRNMSDLKAKDRKRLIKVRKSMNLESLGKEWIVPSA